MLIIDEYKWWINFVAFLVCCTHSHLNRHIHTLVSEAAMQGANPLTRSGGTFYSKRLAQYLVYTHSHTETASMQEQFGVQYSFQAFWLADDLSHSCHEYFLLCLFL